MHWCLHDKQSKTGSYQNHQKTDENGHKIDEQIKCMADVIHIPMTRSLHNHLRVKQNVAHKHKQASIELQ